MGPERCEGSRAFRALKKALILRRFAPQDDKGVELLRMTKGGAPQDDGVEGVFNLFNGKKNGPDFSGPLFKEF